MRSGAGKRRLLHVKRRRNTRWDTVALGGLGIEFAAMIWLRLVDIGSRGAWVVLVLGASTALTGVVVGMVAAVKEGRCGSDTTSY